MAQIREVVITYVDMCVIIGYLDIAWNSFYAGNNYDAHRAHIFALYGNKIIKCPIWNIAIVFYVFNIRMAPN